MTIDFNKDEPLFVERYRPRKVSDCIIKKDVKAEFLDILEKGHIPNMLFSGGPGSGKTTVAKALCHELNMDWMIINASNERGLDVIRDKIQSFCSTVSMTGAGKCFILDEADHLLPATQAALRNASEEFSKSCSFIMTANYPNRIIEPLHSRFVGVDFNVTGSELEELQAKFFARVLKILGNEGIEYDERVLIQVIQKYFPDNRKILGKLQHYGRHGQIDAGILMTMDEVTVDNLIEAIKNKKFKEVSQFAADNATNDTSTMYERIYKAIKPELAPESIPDTIAILEDYQRYDGIVPSKELHLVALGTELMMTVDFQ